MATLPPIIFLCILFIHDAFMRDTRWLHITRDTTRWAMPGRFVLDAGRRNGCEGGGARPPVPMGCGDAGGKGLCRETLAPPIPRSMWGRRRSVPMGCGDAGGKGEESPVRLWPLDVQDEKGRNEKSLS
jgi:hypothetical protein